jgi:mutual gliding-motility protein MglA
VVVVSYSGKEINAKLVYYGAGLSGKTTNLEAIYEAVPETSRGKMVSMKTQSDRTLFFDLLPLDLGEIMGFKTRFLLYTVPGQVFYNATRKLVLKGADGVVFVADSERGKMEENQESLANLRANLAEYGVRVDEIPWVLQYNKRDLPNVYSVEEMNAALNPDGTTPWFEAVASQGKGVFETFRGISHLLMEKVTRDLRRTAFSPSVRGRGETADAANAVAAAPAHEAAAIDFGREITLGDESAAPAAETPATLRRPEPAPAARPAPPAPIPIAVAATAAPPVAASAPAAAAPAPVSRGTLQPEPQLTAFARPGGAGARPGIQPVAAMDEPVADAGSSEAVVPIKLPRNGTREIVLRIVLTDD